MQQPGVEQRLHQRLDAADGDEFGHGVVAGGAHVRQHWHARADAREVVDGQRHAGGTGNRQQVQHRVGGALERRRHRDGVLEGFHAQDVRGLDAGLHKEGHGHARLMGVLALVLADGLLGRRVRQRHAHRLDRRRHGVGGVHAGAGAWAGDGRLLHRQQFAVAHRAGGMAAHGLEHGDDVAPLFAGLDGAAVDEDARPIQPRQRHRARRHVLVAAADGHHAVEALGPHHRFDGVGDDFPGDERIAHPGRAHRDAVGDGDGVEDDALRARFVRAERSRLSQGVDVHVARRHHRPGRRDAHLRLGEVLALEADRIEHGAARRLLHAVDHD